MIESPTTLNTDPERAFECERAIERALARVADEALMAGWNEAEVDGALWRLAEARIIARDERVANDRQIALALRSRQ